MNNAFIDAHCPECDRKIAWFGTLLEHPGCSECGWKPDPQELQKGEDEMAVARQARIDEKICENCDFFLTVTERRKGHCRKHDYAVYPAEDCGDFKERRCTG